MQSVSQNTHEAQMAIGAYNHDKSHGFTNTAFTETQPASYAHNLSTALRDDESKSSFIRRFERHQAREAAKNETRMYQMTSECGAESQEKESDANPKYVRSQSHLDLKGESRFWQSRAELIVEQKDTFAAASRQRSTE